MKALFELPGISSGEAESMPPRWKWTRKQYYKLAEQGYFAGRRVELIEGEIVDIPAVNYPHTVSIAYATKNQVILKQTDTVRILASPKVPIRVADLLP